MKTSPYLRVPRGMWRGRDGRLWRIADHLESTAQAVRYADKPADLVFPRTRLCDLLNEIRFMENDWLAEVMGLDKRDRAKWPKL